MWFNDYILCFMFSIFSEKRFQFFESPLWGGHTKKPPTIKTCRFYGTQFFRYESYRFTSKKHPI